MEKYCEPFTRIAGCKCTKTWAYPWSDAKDRISWWLPIRDWCIGRGNPPGSGISNFRAVLPDKFYENQIREGKSPMDKILVYLVPELGLVESVAGSEFIFDKPENPYDTFPYIYPRPTMWANTVVTALVLWLWVKLLWLYVPLRVAREHYKSKLILTLWRRYRRFRRMAR
jgi:hypothetical protein